MMHADNPLVLQIAHSSADPVQLNRYRAFGDLAVCCRVRSESRSVVVGLVAAQTRLANLRDRIAGALAARAPWSEAVPAPCC